MKWAEMSTEERNALIHEKVMDGRQVQCPNQKPLITYDGYQILEWKCSQCGQTGRGGAIYDRKNGGYIIEHTMPNVPPYTTSMNAAWLVIKHIAESAGWQEVRPTFIFRLKLSGVDLLDDLVKLTPDRICFAALKACGVEIG